MDDPYATGGPTAAVQQPPPGTSMQSKWYDQSPNQHQQSHHHTSEGELRSVTPAMNNTRGSFRHSSPIAGGHHGPSYPSSPSPNNDGVRYESRSGTPNRYLGAYNSPEATAESPARHNNSSSNPSDRPEPPSSTGLIRLSLRKPMGIVFEPMYDPNNPSLQRGVRICDLPRTGAAALSRKLEVGDELLSINDKTMSRLSFDEIMDFIIEADPEEVNLLFRRPRKEALQARQAIKKPSTQPAVKWVDDEVRNKKKDKKKDKKDKKSSRRGKKDEDDTITSQDEEYRGRSSRKKGRGRKHPYESESFLDLLIDTICANPDHACRERRRGDDDYFSDEDEDGTFASQDDSTYVTYESEDAGKRRSSKSKSKRGGEDSSIDEETEEDTVEEKWKRKHKKDKESRANKSPIKDKHRSKSPDRPKNEDKYEDDGTLETVDSQERVKPVVPDQPPLGLEPEPEPVSMIPPPASDDDANPAPIKELEYDDRIDHGADVSVMESLGGPSLLIEKQRMAAAAKAQPNPAAPGPTVPAEFIEKFGKDYPVTFGLTHEQTIQADPLKFYTFVVKGLLEEHEPEKVRLLDKLLAKYKGREEHLVQKLSVRYSKNEQQEHTHSIPEGEEQDDEEQQGFEDHQHHQNPEPPTPKESPSDHHQHNGTPIMQSSEAQFTPEEWPEKETKEGEEEGESQNEEESHSGDSEFSGDSIDGTSPAVIAQVSELLNYVYGKTSVPGQIDRVSTIMRAYEGREAVLLELLETKALIKANKEKENADNLPSFLRNSQAMQFKGSDNNGNSDMPPVTPMATQQHVGSGGTLINDDISSMSGVSSPAEGQQQHHHHIHGQILNPPHMSHEEEVEVSHIAHQELNRSHDQQEMESPHPKQRNRVAPTGSDKKKKKGIFGGLFGGKKNKKNKDTVGALPANDSLRSGSRSRASRKLKNANSTEYSI